MNTTPPVTLPVMMAVLSDLRDSRVAEDEDGSEVRGGHVARSGSTDENNGARHEEHSPDKI